MAEPNSGPPAAKKPPAADSMGGRPDRPWLQRARGHAVQGRLSTMQLKEIQEDRRTASKPHEGQVLYVVDDDGHAGIHTRSEEDECKHI